MQAIISFEYSIKIPPGPPPLAQLAQGHQLIYWGLKAKNMSLKPAKLVLLQKLHV